MNSHYAIVAWDAPDSGAKRDIHRAAHFVHIEASLDKIAIAGPVKNEAGEFTGSLFVVKATTAAEAEAILAADPYFGAGVWSRTEISPFVPAAGEWIGGKTW